MLLTILVKESDLNQKHILVLIDRKKQIIPYDEKLGFFENHLAAAKMVAPSLGWSEICYGDHPDGYVFLNSKLTTRI